MATHLHLLLPILLSLLSLLSTSEPTLTTITKDPTTLQYATQFLFGTPQLPVQLVVDLSGQSIWLHCAPPSSSRHFLRHRSLPCSMAKSGVDPKTTTSNICNVHVQNPITGAVVTGELAGDMLAGDLFLFSCVPDYLLKGLASESKGVLGLGRSKTSYPSQIVNNFNFPRKFTVCLSSSDGFLISGTGISKCLSYTPLVSIQDSTSGYYVNVNSIKVNGERLVLYKPVGVVQISTVVPYTTMESTIYEVFTKAYVEAAISMNMRMVSPVAPFGVCFGFESTVPEIELVLQSEMVKWRIQGRNSMVRANDGVMCLGFLDGGLDAGDAVVIGGYQLEDRVMEFDLGTGMMGFGSSLLMEGRSCSSVRDSVFGSRELL